MIRRATWGMVKIVDHLAPFDFFQQPPGSPPGANRDQPHIEHGFPDFPLNQKNNKFSLRFGYQYFPLSFKKDFLKPLGIGTNPDRDHAPDRPE